jgi:hypothetical protein
MDSFKSRRQCSWLSNLVRQIRGTHIENSVNSHVFNHPPSFQMLLEWGWCCEKFITTIDSELLVLQYAKLFVNTKMMGRNSHTLFGD